MSRLSPLVLTGILSVLAVLAPGRGLAQHFPVFDAHIHYSQPDWSVYSPEGVLAILDRAGVRWAMVSSTPDGGTLRLHGKAPERIVPVLRPYRTRGGMGTWTTDLSILPCRQPRPAPPAPPRRGRTDCLPECRPPERPTPVRISDAQRAPGFQIEDY